MNKNVVRRFTAADQRQPSLKSSNMYIYISNPVVLVLLVGLTGSAAQAISLHWLG